MDMIVKMKIKIIIKILFKRYIICSCRLKENSRSNYKIKVSYYIK